MESAPQPLKGRTVIEAYKSGSDDVTRLSIAFAGRIAADLGANIVSVHVDGCDPLKSWGPLLPNGISALSTFLNSGKTTRSAMPSGMADLITNDSELGKRWDKGIVVVVESSIAGEAGASELTILAASGLLDILGEPGRHPLPLPGNQAAYSAGAATFNALISSVFAETVSGARTKSSVSIIDVAQWLNWKHFLAAYFKQLNNGIGRAEDWTAFQCLDGHIAVVFQDKDVPSLARLVGNSTLEDPKFATLQGRRQNIRAFNEIIARWAKTRKKAEVLSEAQAKNLPFGAVLTVSDLIGDRQMLSRSFLDLDKSSARYGLPRLPGVWVDAG